MFIEDEKTGRTYWLEKGQFMSAPTRTDGEPYLEEILAVSDWENMEPFSEDCTNFQHLIKILERLVQVDGPLQAVEVA